MTYNTRKVKNALILGYDFDGSYTNSAAHHLFVEGDNIQIYVIPIHLKPHAPAHYSDGITVLPNVVNTSNSTVDYKLLDQILFKYKIDIIIQHADFHRYSMAIADFINSRNFFILNHKVPGLPIDMFFFEGGFLRPDLYQLDKNGWNFWNSLTYKELPALTTKQESYLDKWLTRFRKDHINTPISRDELTERYGILPHKKIVVCAMQKPYDSVLRHFSRWCNSIVEFAETCMVIFSGEKYHLLFSQHPLDEIYSPSLDLLKFSAPPWVTFLPKKDPISVHSYINISDAVCVVNSTVGCEAMAFDKPVVTVGYSVYQHYAIGCYNLGQKTIEKVDKEIDNYDQRKDNVRRFLHELVTTSPGLHGISFTELINSKAEFVRL